MKNVKSLILVAILLGFSGSAMAQFKGMYAGGSIGWIPYGGPNNADDQAGFQGTFGVLWGASAQRKATNNFISGLSFDANVHTLFPTGKNQKDVMIYSTVGVRSMLTHSFAIMSHIGAGWAFGNESRSAKDSFSPMVDVGAAMYVIKNLAVTATFTHFTAAAGVAGDMYSAGVEFHF